NKALHLNDNIKHFYLLLTEIYSKQGKFNESVKVYQQLLKKVPKTDGYLYNLAEAQIYDRKYDDAIKTLNQIEKLFGKSDEISKQKQRLYMFLNKTDEAINEAKSLVEANPNEPQHKTALAELLLSLNKKNEAFLLLEKVSQENPDDAYAHLMLYEYYKNTNQPDLAYKSLNKAFGKSLSIDNKVSIVLSLMSDAEKSEEKRKLLIELTQKIVDQHPNEAKSHSILGDVFLIANENEKALSSFKNAINLDASKNKIWQKIITMSADMKQIDSMVVYSEKAIELFPNDPLLWYFKGTGKFLNKDYREAAKALEFGKKLSSKEERLNSQFLSQLGDVYHNLNEHKKSDEAFGEVLKRDSNNAHVLNNYSYFLSLRKENLETAERLSLKLIHLYPNNPTYLDTYAWVLYSMKKYKKAKEALSNVIDLTNNAIILEHYGDILFKLGEQEKAVEFWKKALEGEGEYSEFLQKKIEEKKIYE
ncbi:MAG: tetratricopeptide repeat protein, partial [Cytophagales bacterium]